MLAKDPLAAASMTAARVGVHRSLQTLEFVAELSP